MWTKQDIEHQDVLVHFLDGKATGLRRVELLLKDLLDSISAQVIECESKLTDAEERLLDMEEENRLEEEKEKGGCPA